MIVEKARAVVLGLVGVRPLGIRQVEWFAATRGIQDVHGVIDWLRAEGLITQVGGWVQPTARGRRVIRDGFPEPVEVPVTRAQEHAGLLRAYLEERGGWARREDITRDLGFSPKMLGRARAASAGVVEHARCGVSNHVSVYHLRGCDSYPMGVIRIAGDLGVPRTRVMRACEVLGIGWRDGLGSEDRDRVFVELGVVELQAAE